VRSRDIINNLLSSLFLNPFTISAIKIGKKGHHKKWKFYGRFFQWDIMEVLWKVFPEGYIEEREERERERVERERIAFSCVYVHSKRDQGKRG